MQDPIGYRHVILERFGIDVYQVDLPEAMESVYFLLRERVNSEVGLFRQQVPPAPAFCDSKDSAEHQKKMTAWRRKLCDLEAWTDVAQLDAHLAKPFRREEVVTSGAQ